MRIRGYAAGIGLIGGKAFQALGKYPHVWALRTLAGVLVASLAWPHGGDGGGSSSPAHVGAGLSMLAVDDSLAASVDLYGYFGSSWATGWRTGDPLGSGGKIPLYYNQWLFREAPNERMRAAKPDLRPRYGDFSYIPIWQPPQAALRARYRFLPGLWGTLTLAQSREPKRIEASEISYAPEIEELTLKWAPAGVPGLAFTAGQLDQAGGYCPIFDLFPLEHFAFGGLGAEFRRPLAMGEMLVKAAMGREFLGRLRGDDSAFEPPPNPNFFFYLDGLRERTHILGSLRFVSSRGWYAGMLSGFQALPEDSSVLYFSNRDKERWRESRGLQAGLEMGYAGIAWEHHLAAVRGWGDVKMAWSGPDPVFRSDRAPPDVEWSRDGSRLSHGTAWSGYRGHHARFQAGAWGQWRQAARNPGQSARTGNTGPDSILTLLAQEFRALRLSLQTESDLREVLSLGCRYDRILYLDPDAHANTFEELTDAALRSREILTPGGESSRLVGPSPWEREAADAHVLTPFLQLRLGVDFHSRIAWSGSWYSREIRRQGQADDFHHNVTVAVWFFHRFPNTE